MNTLIAIGVLAVLVLILEIVNLRKLILPISILGLLGIFGYTISEIGINQTYYNNMFVVDNYSTVFSLLFILLTIFLIALTGNFYKDQYESIADFVSLKLFLLMGAVSMVSFGNFAVFFLGLEILSITLYILAGSEKNCVKSNEAGMKYFLMGAFASGFVLFGIALMYGVTGTFDTAVISSMDLSQDLNLWFKLGVTMGVIGLLFKIAAFPFHFWAPDVYEGSPSTTTALMSTLVKVAAIATLFKFMQILTNKMPDNFILILNIIAIATMTVGNIMALTQNNAKRMLAYSGISHAGFMMMAMLSISNSGAATVPYLVYYCAAYSIAGIAAFATLIAVTKGKENENIVQFKGLAKTNPLLALSMTVGLLSMGGIPIFAGFFGKFFLFSQALSNGFIAVVIFGVLNSIVSIYYYFKIVIAVFSKSTEGRDNFKNIPIVYTVVGIVAALLNIAIGIYPSFLLNLW